MSELTLDEAIKHCLDVAEEQSRLYSLCPCPCDGTGNCISLKNGKDMGCTKCAADHRQLAEWLTELKEAKRLLKLAVEDFSNVDYHIYECDMDCDSCPIHGERDDCVKWVHADEALKLIEND